LKGGRGGCKLGRFVSVRHKGYRRTLCTPLSTFVVLHKTVTPLNGKKKYDIRCNFTFLLPQRNEKDLITGFCDKEAKIVRLQRQRRHQVKGTTRRLEDKVIETDMDRS
jgi:hypothetical protein